MTWKLQFIYSNRITDRTSVVVIRMPACLTENEKRNDTSFSFVSVSQFVGLSRNVAEGHLTGERSKYDQIMISFASKAKGLERSCVQLIESEIYSLF